MLEIKWNLQTAADVASVGRFTAGEGSMSKHTEIEEYALGLMAGETGELNAEIGRALRFGLDTPNDAQGSETAATAIEKEAGDVIAAIRWACMAGLIDFNRVIKRADKKILLLTSPVACDNLGRQLAPTIPPRDLP